MHTKFVATVALAALLAGGGATLAMAQPTTVVPAPADCRAPAPNESGYGSRELSLQECQQAAILPAIAPRRLTRHRTPASRHTIIRTVTVTRKRDKLR